MKCPVDNSDLLMTERNGIEIDYCPNCRGVWLDRGELDKIIERSNQKMDNFNKPGYREDDEQHYRDDPFYRKDDDYYKRKKKKGFFGDMFDVD
jgi:Zn-finger nucleic acid-binding protein